MAALNSNPQVPIHTLTWSEVYQRLAACPPGKVWGVPRGGAIVAGLTGRAVENLSDADVIVDDIIDSGATRDRYASVGKPFWALWNKHPGDGWVQFPWEHPNLLRDNEDTVRRQLQLIGEDPTRDGLRDTPQRKLKALFEMTKGYKDDPKTILATTFDVAYDQVVTLKGVRFASLCEHHLLPFTGEAAVGYLPGERVVGLSKLARLVLCYARRLQVQERMTQQIATDIMTYLGARGSAVVIKAHHHCMGCRGVELPQAEMITSVMLGQFRDDAQLRTEFLGLL